MKRKHVVYVAIRHTRSGDERLGVFNSLFVAHDVAKAAAKKAARDYGSGSASVFRGVLTLTGRALKVSE